MMVKGACLPGACIPLLDWLDLRADPVTDYTSLSAGVRDVNISLGMLSACLHGPFWCGGLRGWEWKKNRVSVMTLES